MCDMIVALSNSTASSLVIFGKNSDREPNEPQILEFIPRVKRSEDVVKATSGFVKHVKETYAVLLSRPWWTYGAEMGVNEHGVVMGNVAVFTREPYKDSGLLGMDILRLTLERSRSAREALEVVIELTESPGQGGNYSYEKPFRYHNSYLIVDSSEAWIIETAGEFWAAKRVRDVYSASNALTISDDWDLSHPELVKHGVEKYNCSKEGFNFSKCYSDRLYTWLARGRERRRFTYTKLLEKKGELTVEDFMSILRSHSREPYHPARGSTRDICMHYGGLLRPSHTAASMIVALKPGCKPLILASISPYPCLSAYKPIPFGFNPPVSFKETSNKYNPENYWWVHRRLKSLLQSCYHSQVVREYINGVRGIEEEYLKPLILEYSEGKCVEDESYSILESMIEAENKLLTKASKAISGKYCWRHPFHTLILKKSDGKAGF